MFCYRTALAQVGNMTLAAVGANGFVYSEDDRYVQFAVRGFGRGRKVRITLTPMDTYKVEYFRVHMSGARLGECDTLASYDDVYADMLSDIVFGIVR